MADHTDIEGAAAPAPAPAPAPKLKKARVADWSTKKVTSTLRVRRVAGV
jgi:hypothetical protein